MFDESINMFVYEYTFLDDIGFIHPADGETKINNISIKEIFKKHGWEGDGEIGTIWLPPFLIEDGRTNGIYLWHVKQENNGISYIISPIELHFGYLGATTSCGEMKHSLIENSEESILELDKLKDEILSQQTYMNSVPNEIGKTNILNRALISIHDEVVSAFKLWIDSCFLDILKEKIFHRNQKIKIPKFRVFINMKNEFTDEGKSLSRLQKDWLTQASLISSVWNSFRNDPLSEKWKVFLKSVDYKNKEAIDYLKIHIELRNCVQHSQGIITKDTLERLQKSSIELASGEVFDIGDKIVLTEESILFFIKCLINLIKDFNDHIKNY